MVNNDSITIMQKVEELKQWQKQHELRQAGLGTFASQGQDEGMECCSMAIPCFLFLTQGARLLLKVVSTTQQNT